MKLPDSFRALWQRRAAQSPNWFKDQYEAAADRVQDHTDNSENPYWFAPAAGFDAIPDEDIRDELGATYTPEEAREMAFELLVLADLLEA